MVACRLTLLGGFSLATEDGAQLALPTRKDKLLLAYLALSGGRPQSRERLAALLWGDRAEAQARDSLKQALAELRHAFRQAGLDPLRADRESVAFDPAAIEIDANEFARLAMQPSACAKAIALYRGDLLDGFDGAGTELDEWLRPERERLSGIAVRILEQLAQSPGANSISDEAIQLGRRLLARDRLREPVYRALMRLHLRKDERTEALRLYAACRTTLQEDLGVAPEAKTEELYRDILTGRPSAPSPASEAERTPARPSIAVLPFSNLSGDPALAHLCDGITEDIITGLGRFRLFFVIDRHSSSAVSQQASDIAEIGRRLGVGSLIQGSLKRLGDGVRITVRLIDAGNRAQLWGEAYDCPLSDILAVPDKVIGAIVSTLHSRVESSLIEQVQRKPTLAAYECVLRGIKHLRGYDPDDNRRAAAFFQQALDLDPGYALAYAYRALAELILRDYVDAPETLSLASKAVELDGDDSRCHWILGAIHSYRGDAASAERHYRRAIALNPNDASAVIAFGQLLVSLGHRDEGLDRIREAMRLNPYHPEWYWLQLGTALYAVRRYADAVEALGHVTRPEYWGLCYLAASLAQAGRMEEAAAAAAKARQRRPDFSLANMRLDEWNTTDAEHIVEGLRKAGLMA